MREREREFKSINNNIITSIIIIIKTFSCNIFFFDILKKKKNYVKFFASFLKVRNVEEVSVLMRAVCDIFVTYGVRLSIIA